MQFQGMANPSLQCFQMGGMTSRSWLTCHLMKGTLSFGKQPNAKQHLWHFFSFNLRRVRPYPPQSTSPSLQESRMQQLQPGLSRTQYDPSISPRGAPYRAYRHGKADLGRSGSYDDVPRCILPSGLFTRATSSPASSTSPRCRSLRFPPRTREANSYRHRTIYRKSNPFSNCEI